MRFWNYLPSPWAESPKAIISWITSLMFTSLVVLLSVLCSSDTLSLQPKGLELRASDNRTIKIPTQRGVSLWGRTSFINRKFRKKLHNTFCVLSLEQHCQGVNLHLGSWGTDCLCFLVPDVSGQLLVWTSVFFQLWQGFTLVWSICQYPGICGGASAGYLGCEQCSLFISTVLLMGLTIDFSAPKDPRYAYSSSHTGAKVKIGWNLFGFVCLSGLFLFPQRKKSSEGPNVFAPFLPLSFSFPTPYWFLL